jgi:hypothetical protein
MARRSATSSIGSGVIRGLAGRRTEKVDRKTGSQFVCLEEEWTRGHLQEIQVFMECATTGRRPLADLALTQGTIKVTATGGRGERGGVVRGPLPHPWSKDHFWSALSICWLGATGI